MKHQIPANNTQKNIIKFKKIKPLLDRTNSVLSE